MPDPITDSRHAWEFAKASPIGGIAGLIVGFVLTWPHDCTQGSNGITECSNRIGQMIPAVYGTTHPVTFEWIGAWAGFVVLGAVVGYGIAWVARNWNPREKPGV